MKNLSKIKVYATLLFAVLVISSASAQIGSWDPNLEMKSEKAIENFKWEKLDMESYFEKSYGYVVFPSIGKGGIIIGGAHGRGLVYEQGEIIGEAKMTQISLGFQWGGQAYSEVIFFKDSAAMASFKESEFEFSGQASAVAIKTGASADIAYEDGVAVYTITKAGLMYEAALGGQKFKYLPAEEKNEEAMDTME